MAVLYLTIIIKIQLFKIVEFGKFLTFNAETVV